MSRIYVDRISPYQSGSLTIDGYQATIDTGSFATTGSNTFQGNQTITGSLLLNGNTTQVGHTTQNFTAPGTNGEKAFANVSGASIAGKSYGRTFFGIADYPSFGNQFEDYFAIEYYDGFGYNFGSEFDINGKQTNLSTAASGSGQTSYVRTTDNYDGTSQVSISSGNKIAMTGKVEMSNVLQLAAQDPLPAGGTGQLAVSGSNLYYHNGSSWAQIN